MNPRSAVSAIEMFSSASRPRHHPNTGDNFSISSDVNYGKDGWSANLDTTASVGGLDVNAKPEVINDGPAFAVIDGNFAMPMVTGLWLKMPADF